MSRRRDSAVEDPRFLAAVKLIERTGAHEFRIAHSPEDDGEPTVWWAAATYKRPPGTPKWTPGDAAAALDPLRAVLRLCEQLIDGGQCRHCGQNTIFTSDMDTTLLDQIGCVYAWDPELATFRRGCEGDPT